MTYSCPLVEVRYCSGINPILGGNKEENQGRADQDKVVVIWLKDLLKSAGSCFLVGNVDVEYRLEAISRIHRFLSKSSYVTKDRSLFRDQ